MPEHEFRTEVRQLLDLVIHSLYTNREIFLRELVSNASDAIDRARFEAVSDASLLGDNPEWKVRIKADKDARTLTVSDNGIGMNAEEIEANIGTIASSGTRRFLDEVRKTDGQIPPELIGRFGVGFYSAFMVADKVTVVTRRAGCEPEAALRWESTGTGGYTLEPTSKPERGTDVVLHLPEENEEFLEEWRIRKIVKQYSDFVEHPITMEVTRVETPTDSDGKPIEGAPQKETVKEETLNSRKAIWARPADQVSEEEHHEFYRHISHDFQEPLKTIHWKVEGVTEFQALLYLPGQALPDIFMPEGREHGLHLYVRKVFITDRCEELLPPYLRFVRGVVESADLPLNVSRETLQENKLIRVIRKNLVRKILDTLAEMKKDDAEKYAAFWADFGRILKEGVHLDFENREKIQELLLFESSKTEPGKRVSLQEYVDRMGENQEAVYYVTGESRQALDNAPHLEAFRSHDLEVLFMTDPIDEWVVQDIREYREKKLVDIAAGEISLPDTDQEDRDEDKASREALKPLLEAVGKALGDRVKDVRLSTRLTESACCLVSDANSMGIQMEKIMKAMNKDMPVAKRILELNPDHPLILAMNTLQQDDPGGDRITEYSEMLLDQARLTSGLGVDDPLTFARRVSTLMAEAAQRPGAATSEP
jgi:molecular chaperone HtpG